MPAGPGQIIGETENASTGGPYIADVNSNDELQVNLSSVDVQNPLPIDGDSVYVKDLDIDNCTASGFTFDVGSGTEQEVIESMVSDVFTGKSNASTDNPKTIYLQFKRPILTASFGINSAPGKYFSNTKIVLGQGEHTWTAFDDSADNTQHQIYLFPIEPVKFSSMEITFHTANEIGIGLIGIFKNIEVAARIQALKPDGTVADVQATTNGNLKFSLEEYDSTFLTNPLPVQGMELLVSKGLISGYSVEYKFGQNEDLNTATYEDIWDGGGIYTWPTNGTAPITHIYSTGVDVQPIEIQGLDINGILTSQTITLTGTTVAALTTPLWRCFRMRNVGTLDIGVGNIVHASDSGKVVSYAQINNGNNQTLMAIYTIPAGKTGYLYQGTNNLSDVTRGVSASGRLWMRQYGGVFQVKKTFGVSSDGSGFINVKNIFPVKLPARTDIRIDGISSANGVTMNTTFEILLIDD